MSSSLAKELSRLNQPAPESIDPEFADFGTQISKKKKTNHSEDDNFNPRKIAPEGRKLRIADTSLNDPKYYGKKSSRAEVFGFESDEDISDEEQVDAEEYDQVESEADEVSDQQKISNDNTSDILDSSSSEVDYRDVDFSEDENLEAPPVRLRQSKRKDGNQNPKHVKNQMSLWCELVGFRIRMQSTISAAEKFPRPHSLQLFESVDNEEIRDGLSIIRSTTSAVLHSLCEIREKYLLSRANSQVNLEAISRKRRRTASLDDHSGEMCSELWESIQAENREAYGFCGDVFDRWHRQIHANAHGGRTLKAINKSVTEQVDEVLSGGEKFLERSQMRSRSLAVLGSANMDAEGEDSQNKATVFDPEVYNDTTFYQQLLVSFVNSTSSTSSAALSLQGTGDQSVDQQLKRKLQKEKKNKRVVDTRASKGRKIRYVVHEKLVNFVSPKPMIEAPVDTEQLFGSLFRP